MGRKVLIVSSEELHGKNNYNSCFELALAEGLRACDKEVLLLSVWMLTPINLFKALLIKCLFSFKKNIIVARFSFWQLIKFFFSYYLIGKKHFVLRHVVNGFPVIEGLGISKNVITDLAEFNNDWVNSGLYAFDNFMFSFKPDIIHGHSRFLFGITLANKISSSYSIPYIITEHSSYYFRGLIDDEILPVLQKSYNEAHQSFAVSHVLKSKVEEIVKPQKPLSVIGNALSEIYFLPTDFTDSGIEKKHFEVIAVARLDENKNHRLLIQAFSEAAIPLARLTLIGDGPLFEEYKKLVSEKGMENVVFFTGHLPKEKVRENMLKADLMVVSSFVETFSVVVIEAHACGLPVVSTDCGGPIELIDDSNGIILNKNTVTEMANAIIKIYENRTSYNKQEIRANTIAKYSPIAIASKYINVYEKVLKKV